MLVKAKDTNLKDFLLPQIEHLEMIAQEYYQKGLPRAHSIKKIADKLRELLELECDEEESTSGDAETTP
jgi:hypothetical protein